MAKLRVENSAQTTLRLSPIRNYIPQFDDEKRKKGFFD
jgi:hypothetical protein